MSKNKPALFRSRRIARFVSSAKAAGFGNPPGVFSHQSLKNLKSEQFLDCKVNSHPPYTANIKGQIMTKTIEQLVNDLMTAWNAHDVDGVAAFYASDYEEVDVAQAQPQHGPDAVRRVMLYYLRAFPDLHITLDDLIVNGNRAVMIWTWRGTQKGRVMNIPPTGRCVQVRGTSVLTIEGDQIRRAFRVWDVAGLLRSVGLLTEL